MRGRLLSQARKFAIFLLTLALSLACSPGAGASVDGRVPVQAAVGDLERYPVVEAATRHYYEGRPLEAIARLRAALPVAGPALERRVRLELASIYKDLGDLEAVEREYGRLAAVDPSDREAVVGWAFAALQRARYATAISRFEQALRLAEDHWVHFGLGLAYLGAGDLEAAVEALTRAVAKESRFAVAHELLGTILLQQGRYAEAADALARALRLDSSYQEAYYKLAQAYEGAGRIDEAWSYYDRARRILGTAEVRADVERFVAAHLERVQAIEAAVLARRAEPEHRLAEPLPGGGGGVPVRVGIAEGMEALAFSAGSPFFVRAGGGVDGPLPSGLWEMRLEGGSLALYGPGSARHAFSGPEIRFELERDSATWILYDLNAGSGYFWARREDRQLRGDLVALVRGSTFTVVNVLDIEAYLLAVVPSEMSFTMPMEALKAQAIAARTYTLRSLGGRYASRGFDVLGDVASSAYRGVDAEHARTTEAVLSTQGLVLTYRGSLAETYYHASAGGHTASSREVWGGHREYLQGVPEWGSGEGSLAFPLSPGALERWLRQIPDVYSSRAGHAILGTFRWVQRVTAEEIRRRVERTRSVGAITRIVPIERGEAGHVRSVRIEGTGGSYVVSGDVIRSTLGGLKSSAFKIETFLGPDGLPESFLFIGAGFGHGVGLSQLGAAGMAEAGHTAEEILQHYFRGAAITPNYNRRNAS